MYGEGPGGDVDHQHAPETCKIALKDEVWMTAIFKLAEGLPERREKCFRVTLPDRWCHARVNFGLDSGLCRCSHQLLVTCEQADGDLCISTL